MIQVFIGQNGCGKTYLLEEIRDKKIEELGGKSSVLYLPAELLAIDEMKDTTDKTFAMEYIITEILETDEILYEKDVLSKKIDENINGVKFKFNDMLDEVMDLTKKSRTEDFISVTDNKEYKKLVKINSKDIKNKLGSGHRMFLILNMIKNSTKKVIIIDEPENHAHPSLLHLIANLIKEIGKNKEIYIATHSPKLVEMLDIDLENITILNDNINYSHKKININEAIDTLPKEIDAKKLTSKTLSYYSYHGLINNIKELHFHEFITCLFSKKVYVIEGINDEIFIKKLLKNQNKNYEDYYIFKVFGKFNMLPFINILKQINIEIAVYFDEDNANEEIHKKFNNELLKENSYMFKKDLEKDIKYKEGKFETDKFLMYLDDFKDYKKYDI